MSFHLHCGRIVGFTEDGIIVCTYPHGHSGECEPTEPILRLCRELIEHPCRRECV